MILRVMKCCMIQFMILAFLCPVAGAVEVHRKLRAKESYCSIINELRVSNEVKKQYCHKIEGKIKDIVDSGASVTGVQLEHSSSFLISMKIYFEEEGSTRPGEPFTVLNMWLKNGEVRELEVTDLLKQGRNNIRFLSDLSITDLKKQDSDTFQKVKDISKALTQFTISTKGIAFYLSRDDVGGTASGDHTVELTFKSIEKIIKPDGPLVEFLGNPSTTKK